MDNPDIWVQTLEAIRPQVSGQNYDIWFCQIGFEGVDGNKVKLRVRNRYFQDWIKENYQTLILEELEKIGGQRFQLSFSHWPDKNSQDPVIEPETPTNPIDAQVVSGVDAAQTFKSFVVGSSNQFANAASLAVADNPARTYNPLFIFGGVGLGKTHLLNAIGNHILSHKKNARITYLSSEAFVNELINSLRFERMNEFREKYRTNCDALLVDDIQFLAGKIRTQEEFFYTFNALHSSGKQIVVTCDTMPKDIPGLEERLRNRFEWGLIADIQPPDHETKVAILKTKSASEGNELPNDVCHYIASNVESSVRELEGILVRLSASATFYKRPITLEFTQEVLGHIIDNGRRTITLKIIQQAVAKFYNLKDTDLKSHRKQKQIVWPRQLAMFLCRKHTERSFPEIGQAFGGRDHTTVIYSVKKIEKLRKKDPDVADVLKSLEKTMGL